MICSDCKKNTAVVFVDEKDENGKAVKKGYCYNCAKKHGINPFNNLSPNLHLSDDDIKNMTSQLNDMLNDLSNNISNMSPEELEQLQNAAQASGINLSGNPEDYDDANVELDDEAQNGDDPESRQNGTPMGFAVPLSSLFSGMFNKDSKESNDSQEPNGSTTNVKTTVKKNKKLKYLNTYGSNLTQKARENKIDNVVGRDREIERVVEILNRRTKNNPCLIGEPGVGKTAIALGLALRINNGQVPAKLLTKEVYQLDMTAVVAGTQFRGQFEARMKSIIDECKQAGNVILVIDELHNIVGAGDADHSMNAANILKPSLADGTIQLIGTTTLTEYRKYIEKDSALERRFQPVIVEEPSIQDSIEILKGIKSYYEDYHKVQISDNVIENIVKMSERYIHDRFLPDKAIDVLDEACSRINLENKDLYELEVLKNKLQEVQSQKVDAAEADSTEDYKKAAELKTQELNLEENIHKIEERMKPVELTFEDIARVIESWTKIPVQKITEAETQKLLNLEDHLHERIIGQNDAVESVARAIRRNRAGLKSTKRPPSFIFVGPTGVGKTELSKALAVELFGNEESIIRIDMSEYMESNSTAKLIGAPPGYVGYDDAGQLTEKVKRHPYSIVLLDEIEKAHPDVFNILLQVLDDGRLTDAQGNTVSFENTIIIMTSNVGSTSSNSIGFGTVSDLNRTKIMNSLKEAFRPEFLNRVDEIVVFDSLNDDDLHKIIELMLADTQKVLDDRNIKMYIDKDAKEYLLKKGTNIQYGARPLRRSVQKYIEDELSEMILRSTLKNGQKVYVSYSKKDDKLTFKVKDKEDVKEAKKNED